MIELPQSLKEHLSKDATTLCYVWIIKRKDGVGLGFTDHDQALTIDSILCEPSSGFTAGAVENSLGLSGDTSDVDGILSSDKISTEDIEVGHYDGAKIFQYLVNWNQPEQAAVLRRFFIGEITLEDGAFRVELRSFSSTLDQVHGRYFLRSCDAVLGDAKCGVDLSDNRFRAAGVVAQSALSSAQTIVSNMFFGYPKQWFSGGRLIWTSGDLMGQQFEIADAQLAPNNEFVSISLVQEMRSEPSVGDGFDLIAGCDKRFDTCKTKFGNATNFRGFPHMPGNDAALNYADSDTDYNGAPLVP